EEPRTEEPPHSLEYSDSLAGPGHGGRRLRLSVFLIRGLARNQGSYRTRQRGCGRVEQVQQEASTRKLPQQYHPKQREQDVCGPHTEKWRNPSVFGQCYADTREQVVREYQQQRQHEPRALASTSRREPER